MSAWNVAINALRRELRAYADQSVRGLFGWTESAKSSPMGDDDELNQADEVSEQRPAQRIEPWGLRSRSPKKMRTFWLRLGSSNVLFLGVAPSKGYGPTDLDDGETMLYSSEVERGVHLNKDGDVVITAKGGATETLNHDGSITLTAAPGKTVNVNGSDYSLLKTEDLLSDLQQLCTQLITWVPLAVTGIATPMVGSAPDPGVVSAATTILNKILSGAYKSTKSKNG